MSIAELEWQVIQYVGIYLLPNNRYRYGSMLVSGFIAPRYQGPHNKENRELALELSASQASIVGINFSDYLKVYAWFLVLGCVLLAVKPVMKVFRE